MASLELQGRCLELGAGCGAVSALAAQRGLDVVATDGAERVLQRLRRTAPPASKTDTHSGYSVFTHLSC